MTGEMIERVARALDATRYLSIGASPTDKAHMAIWNVHTSECVADGFTDDRAASEGLRAYRARAAIEALREPTEAMGAAMLLARTYFEDMGNNPRLTEAAADKLRMGDHLAGNPSRWCMPDWRAGIDAALSGKPPEVTRK